MRAGEAFDKCLARLNRLAADGVRLAKGPGGVYLIGIRLDDFHKNLHQAANHLAATRPFIHCGRCNGAGCERCHQSGWICPAIAARGG